MLGVIMKLITCYLCARPQVATDAYSPGELNARPWSFRLCLKEFSLASLLVRYGNSQRTPHLLPAREQVDPVSPGGGLTCHTSKSWHPHANTNTSRSANCRSCEMLGGGGCAADTLMITQHILTYINAIWIC